jgi:hypothetical protein
MRVPGWPRRRTYPRARERWLGRSTRISARTPEYACTWLTTDSMRAPGTRLGRSHGYSICAEDEITLHHRFTVQRQGPFFQVTIDNFAPSISSQTVVGFLPPPRALKVSAYSDDGERCTTEETSTHPYKIDAPQVFLYPKWSRTSRAFAGTTIAAPISVLISAESNICEG